MTDTLNIGFAQWELMKRLTLNIEVDSHRNIRQLNNPDGSSFTLYDIDDTYLKGNDMAFYRIDKNKDGYYLSLIQYLKYDNAEFMKIHGIYDKDILFEAKMNRLDIYRQCFEKSVRKLNSDIAIYKSNRGVYESDIWSKTNIGRWSSTLTLLFIALMALKLSALAITIRLPLPSPIIAVLGVSGFILGIISILKHKDRSLLVLLSIPVGLVIILWVVAEITFSYCG